MQEGCAERDTSASTYPFGSRRRTLLLGQEISWRARASYPWMSNQQNSTILLELGSGASCYIKVNVVKYPTKLKRLQNSATVHNRRYKQYSCPISASTNRTHRAYYISAASSSNGSPNLPWVMRSG